MNSDRDNQTDRTPERTAGERVATLKSRSRRFLLLLHRSKSDGEEGDQSEAPTTWLIYEIVRLEFGEEIAHKVAQKTMMP
jgi:hypothetical protein